MVQIKNKLQTYVNTKLALKPIFQSCAILKTQLDYSVI